MRFFSLLFPSPLDPARRPQHPSSYVPVARPHHRLEEQELGAEEGLRKSVGGGGISSDGAFDDEEADFGESSPRGGGAAGGGGRGRRDGNLGRGGGGGAMVVRSRSIGDEGDGQGERDREGDEEGRELAIREPQQQVLYVGVDVLVLVFWYLLVGCCFAGDGGVVFVGGVLVC